MENLISLIIDLLSALFGSKNEKQNNPSPPANRPDPSRPRPQARPASWEDELRRLLDNQNPPTTAPSRPPPMITPPRPIAPRPVPVLIEEAPARVYSPRPRAVIAPPPLPAGVQSSGQPLVTLSESRQAYERASQLDVAAAARIERVPGQEVQLTKVIRKEISPEIAGVVALFKSPGAARQAVIASIILGPPRAFEERTSANF